MPKVKRVYLDKGCIATRPEKNQNGKKICYIEKNPPKEITPTENSKARRELILDK